MIQLSHRLFEVAGALSSNTVVHCPNTLIWFFPRNTLLWYPSLSRLYYAIFVFLMDFYMIDLRKDGSYFILLDYSTANSTLEFQPRAMSPDFPVTGGWRSRYGEGGFPFLPQETQASDVQGHGALRRLQRKPSPTLRHNSAMPLSLFLPFW